MEPAQDLLISTFIFGPAAILFKIRPVILFSHQHPHIQISENSLLLTLRPSIRALDQHKTPRDFLY